MTKKMYLPLFLSILIAITIFTLSFLTLTHKLEYPISPLLDGWEVSINDTSYQDVDISRFYEILDEDIQLGDHIVMKRTLPNIGYLPNPTIVFRSRYTTLNCYFDDELIYSFGNDIYKNNNFLGKHYHVISLGSIYMDKEIVFDMYATEDNAFVSLDPPILGSHYDAVGSTVNAHLMVIATGIFLIIFGIAFLCIALLFISSVPEIASLLWGALFSIIIGIWLMSYYNVLSFFVYTPYETEIEYISLYLIVPFLYVLIYNILGLKNARFFNICMYLSYALTITQLVLHYIFNIHLLKTLVLYHFLGLLGCGMLFYYSFKLVKKPNVDPSVKVQMLGINIFSIGLLIQVIIYYLNSIHIRTVSLADMIMLSGACLIFAMSQLSTYLVYITQHYARKQENLSLSRLAYADGLTNLPNRSKADKLMSDLDNTTDDYCIISIDLNGLKPINDEFGHVAGDQYIKEFSDVLNRTFESYGLCARMGGDEFLVIIEDSKDVDIKGLIDQMNSYLNNINSLHPEYQRSVATGYAFSHEFSSPTSHKVYMRADQRMYEEKAIMHKELGIKTRS